MAGVDVTPGNVAISQLSSIPFGALIGAPLSAAVKAQAESAMTTVDFILRAGMDETDDGKFVARTVSFAYQDSRGISRILTVPLLAIVQIPSLLIDDMQISFKANISAGTSQESSSTTTVSTETNTSAKARYLWWASGEVNAKFSAKKDSTASANSRYDVEYTMDINVRASQADEPQGLLQVLNIMNDAITARDPEGNIVVVQNSAPVLSAANPTLTLDLIAVSGSNTPLPNITITDTVVAPTGVTVAVTYDPAATNEWGRTRATVTASAFPTDGPVNVNINLSATVGSGTLDGAIGITVEAD